MTFFPWTYRLSKLGDFTPNNHCEWGSKHFLGLDLGGDIFPVPGTHSHLLREVFLMILAGVPLEMEIGTSFLENWADFGEEIPSLAVFGQTNPMDFAKNDTRIASNCQVVRGDLFDFWSGGLYFQLAYPATNLEDRISIQFGAYHQKLVEQVPRLPKSCIIAYHLLMMNEIV